MHRELGQTSNSPMSVINGADENFEALEVVPVKIDGLPRR
jgi:hypothetical protein